MYKLLIATVWTLGFDANVVMDVVAIRFGCDLYGDAAFAAPCRNAITQGAANIMTGRKLPIRKNTDSRRTQRLAAALDQGQESLVTAKPKVERIV
jgi:hypothetical protein